MKKLFLFVFISTALCAQKVNLNLNKIFYGQAIQTLTARSLSMGGAGLAGGNTFLTASHNPALALKSEGSLSFVFGAGLYNLEEDRSFPYYDNFGGFVDYGSYFFQSNWYNSFYGQVVYKPDFTELMNLHLALGYLPLIDFNYDYFEEVRTNDFGDALLAYNIVENEGMLASTPISLAFQPVADLAIGLTTHLVTGDVTYNERIESKVVDLANLDTSFQIQNELDKMPLFFDAGLHYQFDERLALAFVYRSPLKVETIATLTVAGIKGKTQRTVEYPARLGAGVDYRFENILAAQIMIDYYYEFWSDFTDTWNADLLFEDTYNIKIGIEHIFFDSVPFRAGFNYGTLRESKSLTYTMLSVGTGFSFNEVHADLAFGFSSNEHFQDDLYDNALYNLASRIDPDRVRWSEVFGRIDISYTFK